MCPGLQGPKELRAPWEPLGITVRRGPKAFREPRGLQGPMGLQGPTEIQDRLGLTVRALFVMIV